MSLMHTDACNALQYNCVVFLRFYVMFVCGKGIRFCEQVVLLALRSASASKFDLHLICLAPNS